MAALIPLYEASLEPASRKGCRRAIGKLALAFPSAKLNDDEAEARLELYAEALADVPADVLGEACMAIVRESRFFPAPAEIRAKCGALAKRQWELSKIRALVTTHDRTWRPEPDPLDDEERAAFANLASTRPPTETALRPEPVAYSDPGPLQPHQIRIPNKGDYEKLFGIDPDVQRAKAAKAREEEELYDRDLLAEAHRLQDDLYRRER